MGMKNGKKERKQMLVLLERIADVAEHAHHTGAFEDGAEPSVQRYNRIIKSLEAMEVIPLEMFPALPENSSFSLLGAECRMVAGYLEEYRDEDEDESDEQPKNKNKNKNKGSGTIDAGVIAAIAPFLGQQDLGHLVASGEMDAGVLAAIAPFMGQEELGRVVRHHFPVKVHVSTNNDEETPDTSQPDLKAISNMAPFLDKETLTELVRACLARDPNPDPKRFSDLAPFLPREVFGELLRNHFPHWFGKAASVGPSSEGAPETSEKRVVLDDKRVVLEVKADASSDK
jgi:hypothetical protein